MRRNRADEAAAHREAMTGESQLLQAMSAAREQEMEERQHAVERELWLQRLIQLGRVTPATSTGQQAAASGSR